MFEKGLKFTPELMMLAVAEKILNHWDPGDDLQAARKKCVMYELREARMTAETASGKFSVKAGRIAASIAEAAEKSIAAARVK